MQIAVVSLTWNESVMAPFFLRHYEQIADQIVIYDSMSDDGITRDMLGAHPLVKLIDRPAGGLLDDAENQRIKNTAWQNIAADWFIVVDFDEFISSQLGPRAVRDYLVECDRLGITFPQIRGYDMCGDQIPSGGLLTDQITQGVPSEWWGKRAVFHRGMAPNYSPGAHQVEPVGNVWQDDKPFLNLLHYKFLSRDYAVRRSQSHNELSPKNHALKYGYTQVDGQSVPSPTTWVRQYDYLKSKRQPVITPRPDPRFKYDWFTYHEQNWAQHLQHLAGKPNLHFLEIGSFEGRSACWVLDHILTDPTSRLVCVDPFVPFVVEIGHPPFDAYPAFQKNVMQRYGSCLLYRQKSRDVLPLFVQLPYQFDFCYIDGSHTAEDTLADALLVWPLIKPGGIVIFDDYSWTCGATDADRPKMAIDYFLETHAEELDVLAMVSQVTVRKK